MRFNRVIVIVLTVILMQGCILHQTKNPHNDVLVFGTTTKFALDVAAPVQNGGIPEFTLGYKRLEAVWMPLKPNGAVSESPSKPLDDLIKDLQKCDDGLKQRITDQKDRNTFCLTFVLPAGKYVSLSSGVSPGKGGQNLEIDTYSVFASLGAKGTLGFNSASGNLAQFFATGVAAQRLGANPGVSAALNADGSKAAAEGAKAAAEEAKAEKSKIDLQIEKEKANAEVQAQKIDKGIVAAKTILGDKDSAVDGSKIKALSQKIGGGGSACSETSQGLDAQELDKTSVEKFIVDLRNKRSSCLRRLAAKIDL